MHIPQSTLTGVRRALSSHLRRDTGELSLTRVGGGCISPAARVESAAGDVVFLKWSAPSSEPGLFQAEARALEALRLAGRVRVPEVIGVGTPDDDALTLDSGEPSWILMEWLEPGPPSPALWEELGTGLAALHRAQADQYGWPSDNFIGSLPQQNGWLDDWAEFWRVRRLEPQLRLAYDAGWFDQPVRTRFTALLDQLDDLLASVAEDGPSLLHGDLWSGNVHPLVDGEPALIDPASYYGHREVDLAMTELFGGFGPRFYSAYHEGWPLDEGYHETRRAVYQLYYLLVHLNLFGGGYLARTVGVLGEVG